MAKLLKLIAKEIIEIARHPVPYVSLDADAVVKWTVNFFFHEDTEYNGAILHFHLFFPPTFPSEAPIVKLISPFEVVIHFTRLPNARFLDTLTHTRRPYLFFSSQ